MKFSQHYKTIVISLMVGILILVSSLLSSQTEAQPTRESLTKRNRAAAVTVDVVYLNPIQQIEQGRLAFEVVLNTHSVDLDQYALEKISLLRDNKGREIKATAWEGPAGGGHHRSGILIFSNKDDSGKPFISSETKFIELVITNIAGEKARIFHWDLPAK